METQWRTTSHKVFYFPLFFSFNFFWVPGWPFPKRPHHFFLSPLPHQTLWIEWSLLSLHWKSLHNNWFYSLPWVSLIKLGQLFTHKPRARDRDIVRAQKKKCPEAGPRYLPHHVGWLWILECSLKSYVTGPSAKCDFNEFLFTRGPHTW